MLLSGIEKIAVLRAGGIGDLVFALPALESLRAAYPLSEITLLGTSHHRELLEGRASPVDRVTRRSSPKTGAHPPSWEDGW